MPRNLDAFYTRKYLLQLIHYAEQFREPRQAINDAPPGLILEFGVATGDSIRTLASFTTQTVYGFDSFEGLPEDWREGDKKGAFKCDIPEDLPSNVALVVGMFSDTVPLFFSCHHDPIRFAHIDCDLYSSTKTVLQGFEGRLQKGSLLAFDEIIGPGCEEHELKAFAEFLTHTGIDVKCLGRQSIEGAIFEVTAC